MQDLISGLIGGLAAAVTLAAGLGYFGKQLLEKALSAVLSKFQSELKIGELTFDAGLKRDLDFRSQQLTEFYWPIYIRLQKDNAIWNRILDKKSPDEKLKLIATEIEKKR